MAEKIPKVREQPQALDSRARNEGSDVKHRSQLEGYQSTRKPAEGVHVSTQRDLDKVGSASRVRMSGSQSKQMLAKYNDDQRAEVGDDVATSGITDGSDSVSMEANDATGNLPADENAKITMNNLRDYFAEMDDDEWRRFCGDG